MLTKELKIALVSLGGIILISVAIFAWKTPSLNLSDITKQKVLSNTEIVAAVKPAIVYIETTEGVGSGMIIDSEGYILTNAHVVAGVSTAKIKLSDGQLYSAEVKGRDEIIDIAILKISGENFTFVKLGNSDEIAQGNNIFTFGYPFGLEGDVSFKEGTISRRISDGDATYLEISAEIHPGNSGGPIVNHFGEVVGVNSAGFGESIEGVTIGETIKLAIPINVVKGLIPDLKNGREILVEHTATVPKSKSPQAPVSSDSQDDDLFKIKAECASHKGDIEKKMTETYWSRYLIAEVFYSPLKSSCFYAVNAYQNNGSYSAFIIWDYFTGEMIFYRDTTLTENQNIEDMYRNARRYLKGEENLKYNEVDWELSE